MVTCIRRGCLEGKPPLESCELCKVGLERGAPALEPGKESHVSSGRCKAVLCKQKCLMQSYPTPDLKWNWIAIVPWPSWPGSESFSRQWTIMLPGRSGIKKKYCLFHQALPWVGRLPVRTPCTFLQIGHCRNGEGLFFNICSKQSLT